jgi:hypothetical protein
MKYKDHVFILHSLEENNEKLYLCERKVFTNCTGSVCLSATHKVLQETPHTCHIADPRSFVYEKLSKGLRVAGQTYHFSKSYKNGNRYNKTVGLTELCLSERL